MFGLAIALALGGFAVDEGYQVVMWLIAAVTFCTGSVVRNPRTGALFTALMCFGSNGYLFTQKLDAASGPSICNINQVLNCDIVNSSDASMMFGLPITLYGMGFYLGLTLAAMFHEKTTPKFHQMSGLFAIINLIYSAYLAYESTVIGAVCVMCISIYVGNALLLWAALRGLKEDGVKLFDSPANAFMGTSMMSIVGSFLMVVFVGSGTWSQSQGVQIGDDIASSSGGKGEVDTTSPEFLSTLYASPKGKITLDGTEPILGNPDAPYLIVEWADYGCPHCARAASDLHDLVKEMPEVQVRFKVFPLSGLCNPGLQSEDRPDRCRAAHAVECGGQQEKFWELQHLVFVNQTHMADEDLRFMAEQAGLDMPAWDTCFADPSIMEGVRADAMAGVQAGVMGTPAMYLKGTHGDQFVEMTRGAQGVYVLIEAQKAGVTLLPPGPPIQH